MGKLFNSRSLPDALMGGFALFSLKDPSLTLQAKSFELDFGTSLKLYALDKWAW